ncbi:Sec-independent protein translocase TatA [Helicobacter sp. 13S00482-2]|uniref:twin-arginine translocase TatA/TatE family subunit n=1 Tax=Helicobacter sp. 13S00482-2 TaxID=1476200 RepID=UPI000BA51020|nr:twin-arginine translocase TatA/TatE family subunit [Helicobacter sp. 13S00482-2]PAF53988.1 Sec-independent protein translocase TatA [Helicobacter sp. 13S00482-2]
MGGFGSVWHWVIVLLVVVLLFGAKKIPELAKGLGSGIKNFKKAVKEDDEDEFSDASESEPTKIEKPTKTPRVKASTTKTTKASSKVSESSSEPKKRGRKPKSQTEL